MIYYAAHAKGVQIWPGVQLAPIYFGHTNSKDDGKNFRTGLDVVGNSGCFRLHRPTSRTNRSGLLREIEWFSVRRCHQERTEGADKAPEESFEPTRATNE